MKKNVFLALVAVTLGSLLAFHLFKKIDYASATSKLNNKIVLYQVGAFSIYANAIEKSTTFPNSIIKEEDGMFKVFVAIAHSNKMIEKYNGYLESNNINYYQKKIYVNDNCLKNIDKYEKLLENVKDNEVFIKTSKEMLDYYKEECHD